MENILFIAKSPLFGSFDCGEYNGYVAVPPTNKYWGKSDDDLYGISVHGGVTFSEPVVEKLPVENDLFKDLATERAGVLERAVFLDGVEDVPDDYWIFGFDTAHCDDTAEKWTKEAVIEEVRNFSKELLK